MILLSSISGASFLCLFMDEGLIFHCLGSIITLQHLSLWPKVEEGITSVDLGEQIGEKVFIALLGS